MFFINLAEIKLKPVSDPIFAYILYPVSVFEQCEILLNLGHICDEFVL